MKDQRAPKKRYTGVPDILFDGWLPLLDDCELRVILVIIRKTIGWRQDEDELSLNGIAKLAGISKSSVVRATASLIERGLIARRKNIGDDSPVQTESSYRLIFDDEEDSTPEPPTAQPLSHPRTTPEPSVVQPPEPPMAQVIGRDLNTLSTTVISSENSAAEKYETPRSLLTKIFLSRYSQNKWAKLDSARNDKSRAKVWLAGREEEPDDILAAQTCFFQDSYWHESMYPVSGFISQFPKYLDEAREILASAPADNAQDANVPEKVVFGTAATADAPTPAVQRNWLEEWNRLIPEQITEYSAKKHVKFVAVEQAGADFRDNFDKAVAAAKLVIAKDGVKAAYLDLYWLCAYKDGESRANWWRLLFGNLRHMAVGSGANSEIRGPWRPGIVCNSDEDFDAMRAWKEKRRAQNKHTDHELAAKEGDIT